jgi:para-nitrobenzyl esterase
MLGGSLGACHGVDVPFVLGAIGTPAATAFVCDGPEAKALSERMLDAWIAFARNADPNHPGLLRWPAYEAERRGTMVFGRECHLTEDPEGARCAAWEGLL